MGSWNKTCGLSQLPIHAGDRVVTFLLVENKSSYESKCYSNWSWEIIPLPIYGEYSDYGWMEVDDGQEGKLKAFDKFFQNKLIRRKPYREGIAKGPDDLGWNASDDVSGLDDKGFIRYRKTEDKPFASFEALGGAMHGALFGMKNYSGIVGEISHMMIREDVFNILKEGVIQGDGYYSAVTMEYLQKVLANYDTWKVSKGNEYATFIAEAEAAGDTETVKKLKFAMEYADFADIRLDDTAVEEVLKPLREEYNIEVNYDHACVDFWFLEYARCPSRTGDSGFTTASFTREFNKLLRFDLVFDGYAVQSIFSLLRKSYSPMGGEGSQESTNQFTSKFALAYLQALENIDHRWDEDEEEEEPSPDMDLTDEQRISNLKASASHKRAMALKLLQEADADITAAHLKKF